MNVNVWYYLGYVITLCPMGFVVADRVDRSNPQYPVFGSLKRAMAYVNSNIKKG